MMPFSHGQPRGGKGNWGWSGKGKGGDWGGGKGKVSTHKRGAPGWQTTSGTSGRWREGWHWPAGPGERVVGGGEGYKWCQREGPRSGACGHIVRGILSLGRFEVSCVWL